MCVCEVGTVGWVRSGGTGFSRTIPVGWRVGCSREVPEFMQGGGPPGVEGKAGAQRLQRCV